MYILGISSYYHDSAACLLKNGEICSAVQEERFTRKKHDSSFPLNAVRFCLDSEEINLEQVDHIIFYDKPFLTFERLIESHYNFAPRGFGSFLRSMPVWLKEKLFLKRLIKKELSVLPGFNKKIKINFSEHHLSHSASTYFTSPFNSAAILTMDGVGEWCTASLSHGKDNQIKVLKELNFPNSLGLLYSSFTYYLGFKVNSGEYKLMGLAPYGVDGEETQEFIKKIKENLIDLKEDGSLGLDQDFFSYAYGLRMVPDKKWEKLFGLKKREKESEIEQSHCNLALAIQKVLEEVVLKMATHMRELTGEKNICLSGGVALNCVANGLLLREEIFENIWIQPAAGDAGGALGAALAFYYIGLGKKRALKGDEETRSYSFGPAAKENDLLDLKDKYKVVYKLIENDEELFRLTAGYLNEQKIIGWHQGSMEWGPRALGNRSILGDPRNEEMQKKLNLKIKYRESFRPFAPSVLAEKTADVFDLHAPSPYMLLVAGLKKSVCEEVTSDYQELPLREKLYVKRSRYPAITHVDFSARIQTVHRESHKRYWNLLNEFYLQTGCPLLINTSFNVRGEPIVCSAEDAYLCFMRTEMDVLVINNYMFLKEQQPKFQNDNSWQREFTLD